MTPSTRPPDRPRLGCEPLEPRDVPAAPAYITPLLGGVQFTPVMTTGDAAPARNDGQAGTFRMAGIPDGLGAFDNGDGTATVLMNHELGSTSGGVRAHGGRGAFVSRLVVNKSDLSVVSGGDLIRTVVLNNGVGSVNFNRFCSADLPDPSAFSYASPAGAVGTTERIFMNGEEAGAEGRAFGTVVSSGTAYELPRLGKFSWENSVANPAAQALTIVAGTDDSATDGQVYFYVGTKTAAGTPVDRAGLTNGGLYGIRLTSGLTQEARTTGIGTGPQAFTLANLGDVSARTGAQLNADSNAAGVMRWLRPEDGAWDPTNPNVFYFVTTDQFDEYKYGRDGTDAGTAIDAVGRTRLWKLTFADLANPTAGGTVEAVLDGTEPTQMLDNMCVDASGNVILQEDVGNQGHLGKVWLYNPASDALTLVGQHNPALFGGPMSPAAAPFNQDEEASGVIDVSGIFGAGAYLLDVQAHYATDAETVEGGQLLLMRVPTAAAAPQPLGVSLNDGAGQRSVVRSATVTFAGDPAAAAYQLTRTGGGPAVTVTPGPAVNLGGGLFAVTVTFAGADVVGGSLADGRYTLTATLNGAAVSSSFHRLFGDADGDADVDGVDLFYARGAFAATPAAGFGPFLAAFDFDNTGTRDGTDQAAFNQRFGKRV